MISIHSFKGIMDAVNSILRNEDISSMIARFVVLITLDDLEFMTADGMNGVKFNNLDVYLLKSETLRIDESWPSIFTYEIKKRFRRVSFDFGTMEMILAQSGKKRARAVLKFNSTMESCTLGGNTFHLWA